jgi:hypothetical protein
MANMPFFRVIYRAARVRPQAAGYDCLCARVRAPTQQPRQIFFSRAFIRTSSALILSTYVAASGFEAGACGVAVAAEAAAGLS